jgi:hypothetical protein
VAAFELSTYRERAERFLEEIEREYYRHLAGHKAELEIEPIYDRHGELFEREAVERIREAAAGAEALAGDRDDERRRLRYLLQFAFDGLLGQRTKAEQAELARLEATLEVVENGSRIAYRQVPIEQANEPDPEQRAALERARNALLAERLNPLHREALERAHALSRDLGWPGYAAAYADLRGLDLERLAGQVRRFAEATREAYPEICDPELETHVGRRIGALERSDLPRFFRAAALDPAFPPERLVGSFRETMGGLGVDLDGQRNVHLDVEARETKSPRAFCATPRVPDEVYLVVPPMGGRDDFAALFHEGGHTEHFARTDAALPFEFRHLGDNSVTESFAFLFEHLTEDPAWLRATLGAAEPGPPVGHARAVKLVMLRRYAAKLDYELELHSPVPDLEAMPARYAELLGRAVRVEWPRESWLADVDPGLYVTCYLRAWALETHWRRALRERFGEDWFERAEAGAWLETLWRNGQRLDADELLAETLGDELDFGVLSAELLAEAER